MSVGESAGKLVTLRERERERERAYELILFGIVGREHVPFQ